MLTTHSTLTTLNYVRCEDKVEKKNLDNLARESLGLSEIWLGRYNICNSQLYQIDKISATLAKNVLHVAGY